MTLDNLCSIDGFAEKSSKDLLTSLKNKFTIIDELTTLGTKPILPTEQTSKLSGKAFVLLVLYLKKEAL